MVASARMLGTGTGTADTLQVDGGVRESDRQGSGPCPWGLDLKMEGKRSRTGGVGRHGDSQAGAGRPENTPHRPCALSCPEHWTVPRGLCCGLAVVRCVVFTVALAAPSPGRLLEPPCLSFYVYSLRFQQAHWFPWVTYHWFLCVIQCCLYYLVIHDCELDANGFILYILGELPISPQDDTRELPPLFCTFLEFTHCSLLCTFPWVEDGSCF